MRTRTAKMLVGITAVAALVAMTTASPAETQVATVQELAVLEFISGCWRGSFGENGTIEEYYTAADGGLMLGTTRYWRGDRVVQYEFARIGIEDGGVVLTPYPSGRPSEHAFVLTSFDGQSAVFEAPEHDYPKRIIYTRDADGGRTASIDAGAGDPSPRAWKMSRVACGP